MKNSYKLITASIFTASMMFAQQQPINNKCHTDVATKYYFDTHPGAKELYEKNMKEAHFAPEHLNELARNNNNNNSVSSNGHNSYTLDSIPIVFHILHLGGSENVSNSVIYQALAEINKVHGSKTADSANIDPYFASVYGSNHFVFKLATKDPSGNCTNGIIRHYDPNTNWDETQYSNYAYTWNSTKYLNIYVVKAICNGPCPSASGAEGYSYLPGTFAAGSSMDAIVFIYSGLTTDVRGVAHEMGHWFGLEHTFGSTNTPGTCMSGGNSDDFLATNPPAIAHVGVIDDTPKDAGELGCTDTPNSCDVSNYDNGQNVMSYGNCPLNFTDGQIHRMHNIMFSTTANRSNIITAANKIATGIRNPQVCVPTPYFHASARTVCTGAIVTFSDSSENAKPTSYNWSFAGAAFVAGSTATDSIPKVTYATPGTYAVSYTASTAAGGASITKNSYITAVSSVAAYNSAFTEGFEMASVPGTDWNVSHTSSTGVDWTVTHSAAASGSKSVMIDNFSNSLGDTSTLVSPTFNLAVIGSPTLKFKMAYQQRATNNLDRLQIYSSTNCGDTWVSRFARSGTALQPSTVTGQSTSPFVPTSSQFATYTVNINSIASSTNAMFRFVFYAGTASIGNELYLDDINIYNTTVGIKNIEAEVGLEIYPNPSSSNVNIVFTLSKKYNISVNIVDMLGRVVETNPSQYYQSGQTLITIGNKATYQSGIYFVNIDIDGQHISKKIIIQ